MSIYAAVTKAAAVGNTKAVQLSPLTGLSGPEVSYFNGEYWEAAMTEKFFPSLAVDSIRDITVELLDKNNIKGLILDIDNTLVPNHVADADDNAVQWIEGMKTAGFKMCIVSNASKKRVVRFNERVRLYAVHRATKPGTRAFEKAARMMDFKNRNIAVVGDQIFTDVFGGNRVGMFTILVKPIDKREGKLVQFKRILEKRILKQYAQRLESGKKS